MIVSEVDVFTTTLNNEVFVLPSGARTIDLNNVGSGSATILGNGNKGNKMSSPVAIATSTAYSFGDVGKPYPAIVIDVIAVVLSKLLNVL